MTDDRIKAVFEEYGRIVTGKEYALIHAIAEAVSPQRTWVGLTDEEIDQGLCRTNYAMQTAGAWRDGVDWAIKQLKERNA